MINWGGERENLTEKKKFTRSRSIFGGLCNVKIVQAEFIIPCVCGIRHLERPHSTFEAMQRCRIHSVDHWRRREGGFCNYCHLMNGLRAISKAKAEITARVYMYIYNSCPKAFTILNDNLNGLNWDCHVNRLIVILRTERSTLIPVSRRI